MPIPGRGFASPVVWNDRIFVLTAVPVDVEAEAQHLPRGTRHPRGVHQFVVMAIDRTTGRTLWQRVAREQEPHEGAHVDNGTFASSSPVTDGERVYACFESFGAHRQRDHHPRPPASLFDRREPVAVVRSGRRQGEGSCMTPKSHQLLAALST